MNTITIPKNEYKRLKQYSSAYLKIAEEITKAEREFPYDYQYISKLTRRALSDYRGGHGIEAGSVDKALIKFRKK